MNETTKEINWRGGLLQTTISSKRKKNTHTNATFSPFSLRLHPFPNDKLHIIGHCNYRRDCNISMLAALVCMLSLLIDIKGGIHIYKDNAKQLF